VRIHLVRCRLGPAHRSRQVQTGPGSGKAGRGPAPEVGFAAGKHSHTGICRGPAPPRGASGSGREPSVQVNSILPTW
jgi:hypothetical protein